MNRKIKLARKRAIKMFSPRNKVTEVQNGPYELVRLHPYRLYGLYELVRLYPEPGE